jgi:uncharacterized HhH-GPD family protein
VPGDLYITGDPDTDTLLNTDANALMIGMLLDQQIPLEWAFAGPATLRRRLGHLDPRLIAARSEDEFVAVCCEKPAVHRFPASMGRRIHAMCAVLTERYDGRADAIWADRPSAPELFRRLRALPGFGDEKTKIFIALLAKRQGVRIDGWEREAGVFSDEQPRSIADIDGPAALARVKAWKASQRAANKDKQDRPLPSA